jgi:arylsulfatase A-like enzyme
VDTLRQDALGCYGREEAATPNIDALAAGGVRFDQAISSSGWTLPSVASMLTGTWPSLHKALGKISRLTPITDTMPVLAEVYREAGWTTLGFANAAFLSPLLGLDRGFDLFDHEHAYNWDIRRADATVDAALAALDARPGEDVFLLVHLFDAHLDYDPPDGYLEPFVGARRTPEPPVSMKECLELRRDEGQLPPSDEDLDYLRGVYQGEVAFVDRAVGRFVDGLRELGRWDRTTLVLTADHGEEFWEHGGFEHGHTLYDELVRVPLIVRTPGAAATGREVERMVRTIDVPPTMLELSGLAAPASFEGSSLAPLLAGQDAGPVRPAFSQSTLYGAEKMAWRTDRWCLIVDQAREGEEAIELYDIVADPGQTRDLSRERPQVRDQLARALSRFSRDLEQRAATIPQPEVRDMGPSTIKKYLESLEKLGYTGREGEDG